MSESKHTPGPWGWYGSPKSDYHLCTVDRGRIFVMGFARMGMRSAQPTFQVDGCMKNASELARFECKPDVVGYENAKKPGSGVYRFQICDIDHPDARLIAAAPELLEALVMVRDADNDCYGDGLPTIPAAARKAIDEAIAKATGAEQ